MDHARASAERARSTSRCRATRPLRWSRFPNWLPSWGSAGCWSRTSRRGLACRRSRCSAPPGRAVRCCSGARVPCWSPPPMATTAARSPGWRPTSGSGRPCSPRWGCSRRPPRASPVKGRRWCGSTATTTTRFAVPRRSPTISPAAPWSRTPPGPVMSRSPLDRAGLPDVARRGRRASSAGRRGLVVVPVGVGSLAQAVVAALPAPPVPAAPRPCCRSSPVLPACAPGQPARPRKSRRRAAPRATVMAGAQLRHHVSARGLAGAARRAATRPSPSPTRTALARRGRPRPARRLSGPSGGGHPGRSPRRPDPHPERRAALGLGDGRRRRPAQHRRQLAGRRLTVQACNRSRTAEIAAHSSSPRELA